MMLTWDLAKKLLRFLLVLVGIKRLDELGLGRLILSIMQSGPRHKVPQLRLGLTRFSEMLDALDEVFGQF
jgi:hypothetical protein